MVLTQKDETDVGKALLAGAYALEKPADHLAYYRDFATHYDRSFAAGLGYVYPREIAAVLARCDLPEGPILDVGCGTGLVASAIRDAGILAPINGVDLSPEMLEQAGSKGDYAALLQADLTVDFGHLPTGHAAIVSAGTFTHGHLGPDPLPGLLTLRRAGATAAIGVNRVHFESHDFAVLLQALHDGGRISEPHLQEVRIFDDTDPAHAGDTAFILNFRIL